jgi:hypothetical protein
MNMPRFTAEASVYKTRGRYRVFSASSDLSGGRRVLQTVLLSQTLGNSSMQRIGPWNNWWHCWFVGRCQICCSPYWCWWYCYGAATQS